MSVTGQSFAWTKANQKVSIGGDTELSAFRNTQEFKDEFPEIFAKHQFADKVDSRGYARPGPLTAEAIEKPEEIRIDRILRGGQPVGVAVTRPYVGEDTSVYLEAPDKMFQMMLRKRIDSALADGAIPFSGKRMNESVSIKTSQGIRNVRRIENDYDIQEVHTDADNNISRVRMLSLEDGKVISDYRMEDQKPSGSAPRSVREDIDSYFREEKSFGMGR